MEQLPRIRLELENMSYQIVHALMTHDQEISDYVNKALGQMIEEFDYHSVVQEIVDKAIRQSIEHYFSYDGKGREVIENAVNDALNQIFQHDKSSNG